MRKILLGMITFYQKYISPKLKVLGVNCKYYPSCSDYMKQAIIKYGTLKGIFLGVKRIIRCNPFSKGGYDPLN